MEIRAVKFRVGSQWRVGGLYYPASAAATPAVLMLHGFPGVQKNEDIAAELCRRGMTVFMPYYRGCWGSPGLFSLAGMFDDARAALRLLSRYHHVDGRRLGLLGYSLGGWAALRLAAQMPLAAVAVMAPALPRLNGPGQRLYLRKSARVLSVSRVEDVWREYLSASRADHPEVYVPDISPTPLLFVQGRRDLLVPHLSTTRLWNLAGQPKERLEFQDEAHEFQNDRHAVVEVVCEWLAAQLLGSAAKLSRGKLIPLGR